MAPVRCLRSILLTHLVHRLNELNTEMAMLQKRVEAAKMDKKVH